MIRRAFSAHADGGADALSERTGRDVDKRQSRRRMAFEIGVDAPQIHQLGCGRTRPASAHAAVEQGRGVSLRQHEPIAARMLGSFGSNRISAKNSAATRSAAEQQLVGWPLPASDVDLIESMRRRVAAFFRAEDQGRAIKRHGERFYFEVFVEGKRI